MTLHGIKPRFDENTLQILEDKELIELQEYMSGDAPHGYNEADYQFVLHEISRRFKENVTGEELDHCHDSVSTQIQ